MKITNQEFKDLELALEDDRSENFIIDFVLSSLLAITFVLLTYKSLALALIIYYSIRFIYYFCFEYFLGRTPGKFQTQTQVVNIDKTKPTLLQLGIRNTTRFFSLFSGLTDDELAIHDKLSKTFVIKKNSLRKIDIKGPLILISNLGISGFLLYYVLDNFKLDYYDSLWLSISKIGFIVAVFYIIAKRVYTFFFKKSKK